MDFLNLERPPHWAYNWCYFFATMGFIVFFTGIISVLNTKNLGLGITLLVVIVTLIEAATFFTLFWMCRASLQSFA